MVKGVNHAASLAELTSILAFLSSAFESWSFIWENNEAL